MFLGGEECVPLLEWDGHILSSEKGPAASLFQKYLRQFYGDSAFAEGKRIKIEYSNFPKI